MTTTEADLATTPAEPHRSASTNPRRRFQVVLGIAVVVLLLAELGVRLVEDRLPPPPGWFTREYGLKVEQMDGLADRFGGASVAFIGSSVIDVSVDPAQLSVTAEAERPAYNAGLIGANLEMVDVWTEHVVEPSLHPEVVVIGVSSRDVNRNGAGLETQTPRFYDLPAVRQLLGTESALERVERRAGELSHLIRYRKVLRRPLEALFGYEGPDRNLVSNSDLGHELHLLDIAYQGDENVESFFRAEPLRDFTASETQLVALRRTIERLQADDVRVIVLDVPVTSQYVSLHPRGAVDYEVYEIALNVLAAQTGAELIDTGTWQQPAFSDPLHLNGVGADQLTALIDGYLSGEGVVLPAGATPPEPLEGGVAVPVTVK